MSTPPPSGRPHKPNIQPPPSAVPVQPVVPRARPATGEAVPVRVAGPVPPPVRTPQTPPAGFTPVVSVQVNPTASSGTSVGRPLRRKSQPMLMMVISIVGILIAGGATVWFVQQSMQPTQVTEARSSSKKNAQHSGSDASATSTPATNEAAGPAAAVDELVEEVVTPFVVPAPVDSINGNGTQPAMANTPPPVMKVPEPATMPPASTDPMPTTEVASVTPSTPAPPPATFNPPAAPEDPFIKQLVELYTAKKLLVKKEYPAIRKLFADRFAKEHGAELQTGYGADATAMQAWLDEHPDVRDEFYTALDPENDNLANAGSIFNELRKQFPEKLAPYSELGIASAIVWDNPRGGVYEYGYHADRCKASLPSQMMTAVDNFKYYVAAEPFMEGRIRYVPWEFLTHVINHRTPEKERGWAMSNYAGRRVMYGKCYSDVPYDNEMLQSSSARAKLNNQEYNLPNILRLGGVCAMQADFASRVGKSIGISSEYVHGEAAGGELHAWVMWVELKQATPTGLQFTLQSHGRYRGDKYYVGHLNDPQTGKEITDRDLELRLQTVGLDTIAKRHCALVMQAFPDLVQQGKLSIDDQINFLGQVIAYNPGCEEAWLSVAQLARESNGEKKYGKQFQTVLDSLFGTFAGVPDFTWKVFGDLAAYYPEGKPRNALYERLIQLYEQAGRPDLACEARLVWAEMLEKQKQPLVAVQGLAYTVKQFPDEGRYVPKLLDKLEQLCVGVDGANDALVGFYTQVLPLVPQMRGDRPSPFAISMFERATDVFNRCNQPALAQAAQAELAKIKAGQGRRSS